MALTKEQEALYRKTMEEAKKQLDTVDDQMQAELQRVREILAGLQEAKKSFKMIYEGAAKLLGVEPEIEEESENSTSSSAAKMS